MNQYEGLPAFLLAGFADGYAVVEDEEDRSAFAEDRNFLYDLLERLHELEHGRMVSLGLMCVEGPLTSSFVIDWTLLPDNARPIRYKHMQREAKIESGEWVGPPRLTRVDFGYQLTDDNGQNVQVVKQIALG